LETQPVRYYPYGSLAAHLLGYVLRKDPEASFRYSLPTYEGRSGIEKMFEPELAGQTGVKSVLVNNLSYRQREEIESPSEPGGDVCLTIDLSVQRAAEAALAAAEPNTRGAVVVMDIHNGDILAMASCPTFDPTEYITGTSPAEQARLSDPEMAPQLDRVLFGKYAPGSTFKIITSIACLEEGLNPYEQFDSPGFWEAPGAHHVIGDVAGAGLFDFKRAFYKSSNTYFIHYGMKVGLRKILEVAKRFHLGEKTRIGLPEIAGFVPPPGEAAQADLQHSLPDVCIGQEVTTTPLQMAGLTTVIANGGTLFWPRVVDKLRLPDSAAFAQVTPPGRVRDHVQINPAHLALIREAMVLDTEAHNSEADRGSAYDAFHERHTGAPILGGFRVAGKTGSAEVKGGQHPAYKTTWFVSYGPYENPRYAVVVMVDHGSFGGTSCAPVAVKIYQALIKMEQSSEQPSSHGMVAELK
jgi:penicillin-binding protein 2